MTLSTYQTGKPLGVLGIELRKMKELSKSEGLYSMLELDLDMERQDPDTYLKSARLAAEIDLIGLQMKFEEIMTEETGYAREL